MTIDQHKNIVVLMIPPFDKKTGYLPPGLHDAAWEEIARRFGSNAHRRRLLTGLLAALQNLASAGCARVLLDGSFVTRKDIPGDYDGAWEPRGVDPSKLDPVLLDFTRRRAAMKAIYGGELFPASILAGAGVTFRDFFLTDKNGVAKGIVQIDLGNLP